MSDMQVSCLSQPVQVSWLSVRGITVVCCWFTAYILPLLLRCTSRLLSVLCLHQGRI